LFYAKSFIKMDWEMSQTGQNDNAAERKAAILK
jgi:hypothetical protein